MIAAVKGLIKNKTIVLCNVIAMVRETGYNTDYDLLLLSDVRTQQQLVYD